MAVQVVWFKRDLRLADHAALHEAAKHGPVVLLYMLEPDLWQQPDMSVRHYTFLTDCVRALQADVKNHGQELIIRTGEAVSVLADLHATYGIAQLWSHQETWNSWTYARDQHVQAWAKQANVAWHEPRQYGVIRRLSERNGWAGRWYALMQQPCLPVPAWTSIHGIPSDDWPDAQTLGLLPENSALWQRGGRDEGLQFLHSFLHTRGQYYSKAMSSPLTAADACSRLSPYLAFGTISMREVLHACEQRSQAIKNMPAGERGKWPGALRSFAGRLRWHCHFMQKLEDEPRLEFEHMHPAYNGLRVADAHPDWLAAWKSGNTGYPMVDACMRSLIATGWLNFRMRAMLMSFASYHLWLDWHEPSLHLARLFIDYEPGIHYSQVQMQSGTTGMNAIRIYNPIKQGMDHDPDGIFIRRWLPELAHMQAPLIHTPWLTPEQMHGYPMPIVDEKTARKAAANQIYALRKGNTYRVIAEVIVQQHGSRKPLKKPTKKKTQPATAKRKAAKADKQMELKL